jgi:PAS domain S-box-containing protein
LAQNGKSEYDASLGERPFREIVDVLPAAIYTTDAEGFVTYANAAAVDLAGRASIPGVDRWCVTEKLFTADGEPLPHDQCPMATAMKEGLPIRGVEAIAERPDGRRFWFTPFPTPLRDASGKVTGGVNMLVDITDRKRAEEALRRSEEMFRGIFESSSIGVAVLTPDARFDRVKPRLLRDYRLQLGGITEA